MFIEKILLSLEEEITAFDFITIKPLGKSPNGVYVSSAIAIGLKSGIVLIYDLFGNLLLQVNTFKEIK